MQRRCALEIHGSTSWGARLALKCLFCWNIRSGSSLKVPTYIGLHAARLIYLIYKIFDVFRKRCWASSAYETSRIAHKKEKTDAFQLKYDSTDNWKFARSQPARIINTNDTCELRDKAKYKVTFLSQCSRNKRNFASSVGIHFTKVHYCIFMLKTTEKHYKCIRL